jgi:hypothetical protein
MRVATVAISLFVVYSQRVEAGPRVDPAPRTLDEKVRDANLIVLGAATAFGDRKPLVKDSLLHLYERSLRVKVAAVLWPDGMTDTREIVFRYGIVEAWPKSWWDYTNTPGVFFLTRNIDPTRGKWDRLPQFDDWLESSTNALAVLLSIEKQKGKTAPLGTLEFPQVAYPINTRYDYAPALLDVIP